MSTDSDADDSRLTTSDISAVVFGGVSDKGSPSTTNVQKSVSLLQSELLTDHVELVVLQFFQRLLSVDVRDDTAGVDHSRSEEPRVKVISPVVVVSDLVLVLALGVDDDFGNEVGEDVFEQLAMRCGPRIRES
jgi:hypothetical protein